MNDIKISDGVPFLQMIFGCFKGEPDSLLKLDGLLLDKGIALIAGIPLYQFKKYLEGVKKVEDDLGNAVHLADKLFGDEKKAEENGIRVYEMVTSVDSTGKIHYLINATRAFLLDEIDLTTFFRIFSAIKSTQIEDLEFLKNNIEKGETIYGNIQILALARSGLMILTDEDYERGAEEQGYKISTFGYMVDCFALSNDDDERIKYYKNHEIPQINLQIPHDEFKVEGGKLVIEETL